MNTNYVASHNDYKIWLKQKVWITPLNKCYRWEYIPMFAEDLTNWMKYLGYKMNGAWGNGSKAVAKWLYAIQVLEIAKKDSISLLAYPEIKHRNLPEDRDRYEIVVTYDEIEKFLKKWSDIDDLDMKRNQGRRVREELSDFLYHYIDLESSKHGIAITRYLEDGEEDEEEYLQNGKPKNKDQYLLDAEEGWHK
jgi:hypothetical protein